jgi:hypothetical protein
MRTLAVVFAVNLLGCKSECEPVSCEKVDRGPREGDVVIALDTATAFVRYAIDDFESDLAVTAGELVLTTDDAECVASSDHPCTVTLERLRIALSSMSQPTTEGNVRLDDPVLSLVAPFELTDAGGGFVLEPERARIQTCVSVDGRPDASIVPLEQPLTLGLDFANEGASLEGTLPLAFAVGGNECVRKRARATIVVSGKTPWKRP